jgi:hypothetical protein
VNLNSEPTILVSLSRELVEQLAPGAIHDAEVRARAFPDEIERRMWAAGRVGIHLEAAITALPARRDSDGTRVLSSPANPMAIAHEFIASEHTTPAGQTLYRYRGRWWRWDKVAPGRSRWLQTGTDHVRDRLYLFCEHATYINAKGKSSLWSPNPHKIAALLEALAAVCYLDSNSELDDLDDRDGQS